MSLSLEGLLRCLLLFFFFFFLRTQVVCCESNGFESLLWVPSPAVPSQAKREWFRFDYKIVLKQSLNSSLFFLLLLLLKSDNRTGSHERFIQRRHKQRSTYPSKIKHHLRLILFLSLIFFFFFFHSNIYKGLSPAGLLFMGDWEWDSVQCHQWGSYFDQSHSAWRGRNWRHRDWKF